VSGVNANPSCPTVIRYSEAVAFQRIGPGPLNAPTIGPWRSVAPDPNLPPGAWNPDPFTRPDPDPVQSGPDPVQRVVPRERTFVGPKTRTRVVVDKIPPHKPAPPLTKERKFRITLNDSNIGKFLSWAFGQVTEYSDLIDCLWDALPPGIANRYKRRQSLPANSPFADDQWCAWDEENGKWNCGIGGRDPGLDVKTRVLYQHYNSIMVGTFLECVVQNALIDSAIGKLGKIGVEAAIKQGRPISFEFGPAL